MAEKQKKDIAELLAALMQGFLVPLAGVAAWVAMIIAFLFYDVPINPMLMSSSLALMGINQALKSFGTRK